MDTNQNAGAPPVGTLKDAHADAQKAGGPLGNLPEQALAYGIALLAHQKGVIRFQPPTEQVTWQSEILGTEYTNTFGLAKNGDIILKSVPVGSPAEELDA